MLKYNQVLVQAFLYKLLNFHLEVLILTLENQRAVHLYRTNVQQKQEEKASTAVAISSTAVFILQSHILKDVIFRD